MTKNTVITEKMTEKHETKNNFYENGAPKL